MSYHKLFSLASLLLFSISIQAQTLTKVSSLNASSKAIDRIHVFNGTIYFSNGKMYKYDGSNVSPVLNSSQSAFGSLIPSRWSYTDKWVSNSQFILFSYSDTTRGTALWRTDGSSAGTVLVKDINLTKNGLLHGEPQIMDMALLNNIFYFAASDGVHGTELWRSDGTTAGTFMIKDLTGDLYPSDPQQFILHNGLIYFRANHSELWKTDGTAQGTTLVRNFGNAIGGMVSFNNKIFFTGYSTVLWETDGTAAGSKQVGQNFPICGGVTSNYTVVGNRFFFSNEDLSGNELWVSDGTVGGTQRVKDIYPGSDGSGPGHLKEFNGKLIFTANDPINGFGLWVSDGTSQGTTLLSSLNVSPPNRLYGVFDVYKRINNNLYFVTMEGDLWKTDGTANGTANLLTLKGPNGIKHFPSMENIVQDKGTIYIAGSDSGGDVELFKIDIATPNSTDMLSDKEYKIDVFPNPTADNIKISRGKIKPSEVRVSDLYGRTIFSKDISKNSQDDLNIEVSHLSKGVYILSVIDKNGGLIDNTKFIKK